MDWHGFNWIRKEVERGKSSGESIEVSSRRDTNETR